MSIVMIIVGVVLVALATFIDKAPGDRSSIGNLLNVLMYLTGLGFTLIGVFKILGV